MAVVLWRGTFRPAGVGRALGAFFSADLSERLIGALVGALVGALAGALAGFATGFADLCLAGGGAVTGVAWAAFLS